MSQLGTPNRFYREEGSGVRNQNERICFILNPRAAAGRAGRERPSFERAAERAFAQWELKLTERPGHASELAADAAGKFDLVAAVGGDGTCHEVVNGLFSGGQARSRKTIFTVIPFGTGSDLMKSLKMPRRLANALWVAGSGVTLPSDIGMARVTRPDGELRDTHFINVAGFGANGDVVHRVNQMSKRLGGTLTFLKASIQTTLKYQPRPVRLSWQGPEGEGSWEGRILSCFVANGAYCGGGMWVGKGGHMHDGLLDITVLPDTPVVRQLSGARRLYNGSLHKWPGAMQMKVTELTAEPLGEPALIDLDGELSGKLPATFKVLPRALHIRGGWVHNPLLQQP